MPMSQSISEKERKKFPFLLKLTLDEHDHLLINNEAISLLSTVCVITDTQLFFVLKFILLGLGVHDL